MVIQLGVIIHYVLCKYYTKKYFPSYATISTVGSVITDVGHQMGDVRFRLVWDVKGVAGFA